MDAGGTCESCHDKWSGEITVRDGAIRVDTLLPRLLRSHQLEHPDHTDFKLFVRGQRRPKPEFIGFAHVNSAGIDFALTRRANKVLTNSEE